jgi:hypothetical protein
MTDQERRAVVLAKRDRKRTGDDRLSAEHRKRFEALDEDFYSDAMALVEGLIDRFQRTLERVPGGKSVVNRPVVFSQGRSLAITGLLARLWATQKSSDCLSRERLADLEKRVADLEARPVFEDAGVYAHDKSYVRGQGVTENGSFWIAKRNIGFGEKPGACDGWRLAVKKGRDAREARA